MPKADAEEFFIVRQDGSVIMRFFLEDVKDVGHLLKGWLDAERRGVVSFGKRTIGGSDAVDERDCKAAQ